MRSSNGSRWLPLGATSSASSSPDDQLMAEHQIRANQLANNELKMLNEQVNAQQQPQAFEHNHQSLKSSHQQPQQLQPQQTAWTNLSDRLGQLWWQLEHLAEQVIHLMADHLLESFLICVIIIYLVYYFTRVSRKPRVIGNKRSDFVRAIHSQFKDIVSHRFSPLIYFWGTNPQTCLFGYLNGNESTDEMPRSKFRRQFLYVSDVQYLTSNVDLSQHYEHHRKHEQPNLQPQQQHAKLAAKFESTKNPIGLDKKQLVLSTQQAIKNPSSQMCENLRLALNTHQDDHLHQHQHHPHPHQHQLVLQSQNEKASLPNEEPHQIDDAKTPASAKKRHSLKHQFSSGSSSSGSDSGVFAACQTSSSASSSSLTIDMSSSASSSSDDQQPAANCSCSYASEQQQQKQQQQGKAINLAEFSVDDRQPVFIKEELEFGQCALDWHTESHKNYHQNKQVALISAGMTTGSDKKYVTDTVSTLIGLGYEVCVFIRRGVGGLKLSSTRFFSPSKWRDFEAAVLSVRRQRPGARLIAIGFSFGSIELCRYLAMSGPSSLVNFALLISCPFDPEAGGRNMRKRALNRKIDAYLAKNLGKQLYQAMTFGSEQHHHANDDEEEVDMDDEGHHSSALPTPSSTLSSQQEHKIDCGDTQSEKKTANAKLDPQQSPEHPTIFSNYNGSLVDLSRLPKIKSLVDFEDNYNRIIQNYPNSDAYAADSRLNDQLANIATPTLCLSSEDDFMAPLKLLPLQQIEQNKNLCMILTKRGGHMAFIDGLVWPRKPYFAQRIISKYIKTIAYVLQENAIISSNNISSNNDMINDCSHHRASSETKSVNCHQVVDTNDGLHKNDKLGDISNENQERDRIPHSNHLHHHQHHHQKHHFHQNLHLNQHQLPPTLIRKDVVPADMTATTKQWQPQ